MGQRLMKLHQVAALLLISNLQLFAIIVIDPIQHPASSTSAQAQDYFLSSSPANHHGHGHMTGSQVVNRGFKSPMIYDVECGDSLMLKKIHEIHEFNFNETSSLIFLLRLILIIACVIQREPTAHS